MTKKSYIKCNLYSIKDDFSILDNKSVSSSIMDSDKKFLRKIVVNIVFGKMYELFTGVQFDYSDINVYDYYSKIFRKNIIKEKIKHSSEPIHVSLYSEDLTCCCVRNINYEYISDSDVFDYYNDIIAEFGTLENYENHLLALKEIAYNKLDDAVKEHGRCKKITLTKTI